MKNMKPNEAAAMAIQLFSQEARLCEPQRKIARTQDILVKPVSSPEGKFWTCFMLKKLNSLNNL